MIMLQSLVVAAALCFQPMACVMVGELGSEKKVDSNEDSKACAGPEPCGSPFAKMIESAAAKMPDVPCDKAPDNKDEDKMLKDLESIQPEPVTPSIPAPPAKAVPTLPQHAHAALLAKKGEALVKDWQELESEAKAKVKKAEQAKKKALTAREKVNDLYEQAAATVKKEPEPAPVVKKSKSEAKKAVQDAHMATEAAKKQEQQQLFEANTFHQIAETKSKMEGEAKVAAETACKVAEEAQAALTKMDPPACAEA